MAFENGYNMFNYCEELLQNIKKINLYFTKHFRYCLYLKGEMTIHIVQMNYQKYVKKMLGYDLNCVTDFCGNTLYQIK